MRVIPFAIVLCCCGWHAQASQLPSSLSDLPLIEVEPRVAPRGVAIFYSGDGGWAALVRSVSSELAAAGVRVIGVNSLRYFWSPRRQDEATGDLARILRTYLPEEAAPDQVMLIGYSRGADVLPFLLNRLPEDLRRRVGSLVLIAPGHETTFEIHVGSFLSGTAAGLPVIPQIERLDVRLLCLYGDDDADAVCPELSGDRVASLKVGHGHHLSGAYNEIAKRILSFESSRSPKP